MLILLPASLVGSGCSTTGEPVAQTKVIESDVYTIEFRDAMLDLSEASRGDYSAFHSAQLSVVAEITQIRTILSQQRANQIEELDGISWIPVLPRIMAIWNPIGYTIDDVKAALGEPTRSQPDELIYSEVYPRSGVTYILGTRGRRVVSVELIPGG